MSTSWQPPPAISVPPPDELESVAFGPDGTRIFVRRRPGPIHSQGPTVVLCDGILCDGFIWKYLWKDLAELGPVAHWHYRGHGRSGAPVDPTKVGVLDYASDLDAVRTHLGDPRVVLVGHSFGVMVALEAYRRRRERVDGLVLCCGAAGKVTETFGGTNVLAQWLPRILAWATDHPDLARAIWSRLPSDISLQVSYLIKAVDVDNMRKEDLLPYLKHVPHVDFGVFLRALQSAGEHTSEDLLASIDVPALVIAAERDKFTPPELAEKMAKGIPGGELLVLKNGSHAAIIEQSEIVRARVTEFLNDRVRPVTVAANVA